MCCPRSSAGLCLLGPLQLLPRLGFHPVMEVTRGDGICFGPLGATTCSSSQDTSCACVGPAQLLRFQTHFQTPPSWRRFRNRVYCALAFQIFIGLRKGKAEEASTGRISHGGGLSPQAHPAVSGEIFDGHNWEQKAMACSRYGAGVPLNILQCTGESPTQHVSCARIQKLWCKPIQEKET